MKVIVALLFALAIILPAYAELSETELVQLRAKAEQEVSQLLGSSQRSVRDATNPFLEKATARIEAYLRKNAILSAPSFTNRRILSDNFAETDDAEEIDFGTRSLLSSGRQDSNTPSPNGILAYFLVQQDTSFDVDNTKNIRSSFIATSDPGECSVACYNRTDCRAWTIKTDLSDASGCYLRGANYTTTAHPGWVSGSLLPEYQWSPPAIPSPSPLDPSSGRFAAVLQQTQLFFDAQRSGPIPDNYTIPWRASSHLTDPVVGGWYDNADTIKAALPTSISVSFLSWAMLTFPGPFNNAGIYESYANTIRVATDYLLASYNNQTKTFVAQIGNPRTESDYWGRPENETGDRPAYIYDPSMKASDLLSTVAAAWASFSLVYRPIDAAYADQLLSNAKSIYAQAISKEGRYSDYYKDATYTIYPSSDIMDNQAWGAMWMYRATNDTKYLAQASKFWQRAIKSNPRGADVFVGWDSLWAPVSVMARQASRAGVKVPGIKAYTDWWTKKFSPAWIKADGKFDIIKTPLGMKYPGWNQYSNFALSSAASMAMLQDAKGIANVALKSQQVNFAKEQIDYILGAKGHSFVVNWGASPPAHIRHGAASCPSPMSLPCDFQNLYSRWDNPQLLNGGVAGGPGGKLKNATNPDYWVDVRTDFATNEASLDLVSAFAASLAGLASLAV